MTQRSIDRLVRWSSVLSLVGVALVAWSVLVPLPLPILLAMSLAQLIGTIALALYVLAVFLDLHGKGVLGGGRPPDAPP